MQIEQQIKQQIASNNVLLYMKGNPRFPMCGFSSKVAKILQNHKTAFKFVNILEHPDIRATLPKIANWPTFPQLYVKGELIGGCDIILEINSNGELLKILEEAEAIQSDTEFADAMN